MCIFFIINFGLNFTKVAIFFKTPEQNQKVSVVNINKLLDKSYNYVNTE